MYRLEAHASLIANIGKIVLNPKKVLIVPLDLCQIFLLARLAIWENRFVLISISLSKGETNKTISHIVCLGLGMF